MDAKDIVPGMKVRFLSYEDIGDEYRDMRGEDRVNFGFPKKMRHLCGTVSTVRSVSYFQGAASVNLYGMYGEFFISPDMIIPAYSQDSKYEFEPLDISFRIEHYLMEGSL